MEKSPYSPTVGACEQLGKTLAFRPTPKIEQHIKQEQHKHRKKSKSDIIIELCNKALAKEILEETTPLKPTTQQTTGILLACPQRTVPVPYEKPFVRWKTPVDSSVCESCGDYPCDTWEDVFAEKRMNPQNKIVQNMTIWKLPQKFKTGI